MNNNKEKTIHDNCVEKKPFMNMSRRRFCQLAGATVAAVALGRYVGFDPALPASAFYQSTGLSKFTEQLRGVYPLDSNGIPVAVPDGGSGAGGCLHYKIDIKEYTDTLHSSMGTKTTTLWGYKPQDTLGGAVEQRHLGGIIVARRGDPIQITFTNMLPTTHILPVDPTIMGVVSGHHNKTSVHLHGGLVPWISDGGPFSWFGNVTDGDYGLSVPSTDGNILKILKPSLGPGQAEYYYPNNQSARLMWYHDHAIGITRLNAYAGIASAYILRDDEEAHLAGLKWDTTLKEYVLDSSITGDGLPDFIERGGREIPLVFQDKIFVNDGINNPLSPNYDANWTGPSAAGSLWYPHKYENGPSGRWGSAYDINPLLPDPSTLTDPSAIPEFFGDTMLVNGVVHPKKAVEPRRYRLRILNACGARFLNLQLYVADSTGGITLGSGTSYGSAAAIPTNAPGPDFLVIGNEGGFLTKPVKVYSNQPMKYIPPTAPATIPSEVLPANPGGSLITAPAERWDVIIDFKGFEGKSLILYNDAPGPYPGGDPLNDYQDIDTLAVLGHNTRNIMRFDVGSSITLPPDDPLLITTLTPMPGIDSPLNPASAIRLRKLTLNEVFDENGRLIQMLGTNHSEPLPTVTGGILSNVYTIDPPTAPNFARQYDSALTEHPMPGDIEIWEIANLTMDTHPMHFHLVNVQLLKRQPFSSYSYDTVTGLGTPTGLGTARGPEDTEKGWKETVKMHPGEVTTIIMKFVLPSDSPGLPFPVPESPRTGGHEYVWHCHILEHEEHDMMRPLVVGGTGATGGASIPEFPSIALPVAGTIAALALAGKMKNEDKEKDTE